MNSAGYLTIEDLYTLSEQEVIEKILTCEDRYLNEIDKYLGIKDFEQICGFIIGNPIYNYPPKIKKDLKDLLLN